jgi:hypothetical protein
MKSENWGANQTLLLESLSLACALEAEFSYNKPQEENERLTTVGPEFS